MNKISKVSLVIVVLFASAFALTKYRQIAITSSTIDSTTIGATTPSTAVVTQLSATSGITNSGGGLKHIRGTSCTTAASTNATCLTTITWPGGGFTDTNYTYVCSLEADGGVAYQNMVIANKTAATVQMNIVNTPGNVLADHGTYNCVGMHD